ncbi:MAG: hypothetical protein JNJ73_00285 [Hyphomonadaceae bacterium]|nr:hypothetical protein [Hyphomonadaceae bacterium]
MKIDARITLALMVAVVLQAAGGFIWTGKAAARLDAVEARIAKTDEMAERLVRLEEQLGQARASLARIERRLERD